jgi:TRAP-type uncharacterized transport system substrate-binding protein
VQALAMRHRVTEIGRRLSKPLVIVLASATLVLVGLYVIYRVVEPLPPHRLVIAAGIAGTTYDDFARQYAQILARHGVALEVRNYAGATEHFGLLRDSASGVQAAITTFGFTGPRDAETLYSLGGISDTPVFIFYRGVEPVAQFAQLRGKRLSIGMPTTSLRTVMLEVLKSTGALDASTHLVDLDYAESIDALIAGEIDAAVLPTQLDDILLQRALGAPGVRLMNVTQAEAISKVVPGLKHVVLWRGLISLPQDLPAADTNLLAVRNRMLVRRDLHPALQYLLLEAMREAHGGPGPFNRLGEFPAEQANDLPLSPTAEAFFRSGSTFWQRYTSYWLTSLLDRIVFFVLPVVVMLIPLIGFVAPLTYRWLHVRRIQQLHRALGKIERELAHTPDASRWAEQQARIAEIESAVRSLKVGRSFEVDLQLLRFHLRMVQEDVARIGVAH